nr:MAG TPA: hypothetical protein [Caudoviricetes sp.]
MSFELAFASSFLFWLCFKLVLIIQNFRIIHFIWCSIINVQTFV